MIIFCSFWKTPTQCFCHCSCSARVPSVSPHHHCLVSRPVILCVWSVCDMSNVDITSHTITLTLPPNSRLCASLPSAVCLCFWGEKFSLCVFSSLSSNLPLGCCAASDSRHSFISHISHFSRSDFFPLRFSLMATPYPSSPRLLSTYIRTIISSPGVMDSRAEAVILARCLGTD